MDKTWVTDKFYSHFPSYTDQSARKREILVESRRQDYQNYLKQMLLNDLSANKRQTDNHHSIRKLNQNLFDDDDDDEDAVEKQTPREIITTRAIIETTPTDSSVTDVNVRRRSPRSKKPFDAKHIDLPDLFDDEAIKGRNQRVAEENHMKKIKYQHDLLEQIEQKRKDADRQRAKDEEYDEKLTRKIEDHLKTVRLEEELETAEQKRKHNISERVTGHRNEFGKDFEPDFKSRHRIYDKRKAQSEDGKENYSTHKRPDKTLYNYFTNSARQYMEADRNVGNIGASHAMTDFTTDDLSSIPSSIQIARTRKSQNEDELVLHCRRCQAKIDSNEYCNHCKYRRHHYLAADDMHDDFSLCENCSNRTLCSRCVREICMKCHKRKKPKSLHFTDTADKSDSRSTIMRHNGLPLFSNDDRKRRTRQNPDAGGRHFDDAADNDESESEHELDIDLFSPVVIKRNTAPYSLYLERNSIFHPSRHANDAKLSVNVKNGEIFIEQDTRSNSNFIEDDLDEIRRITNEKLSKYGRNRRKSIDDDSNPLSFMNEVGNHHHYQHYQQPHRSPMRNTTRLVAALRDSPAFKMLEQLELEESELDQFR